MIFTLIYINLLIPISFVAFRIIKLLGGMGKLVPFIFGSGEAAVYTKGGLLALKDIFSINPTEIKNKSG